jgi:hypothetical protein
VSEAAISRKTTIVAAIRHSNSLKALRIAECFPFEHLSILELCVPCMTKCQEGTNSVVCPSFRSSHDPASHLISPQPTTIVLL